MLAISGQFGLLVAEVLAIVIRLVIIDTLFSFTQLKGIQSAFPQDFVVLTPSGSQSTVCYPLIACFRVEFQVQCHLIGIDFSFQGLY